MPFRPHICEAKLCFGCLSLFLSCLLTIFKIIPSPSTCTFSELLLFKLANFEFCLPIGPSLFMFQKLYRVCVDKSYNYCTVIYSKVVVWFINTHPVSFWKLTDFTFKSTILTFQIVQLDLTEVRPCFVNQTHPVVNHTIQVIQVADNHEIIVKSCHIEKFKATQYCNWLSNAAAIGKVFQANFLPFRFINEKLIWNVTNLQIVQCENKKNILSNYLICEINLQCKFFKWIRLI